MVKYKKKVIERNKKILSYPLANIHNFKKKKNKNNGRAET
jgi:hypothetical protein